MFFLIAIFSIIAGSSVFAVNSLSGNYLEYIINGGSILGNIPIRIDSLSGWMILIINITMLTGSLYGKKYLEHYKVNSSTLRLHYVLIVIFHLSMLFVCVVQNFIAFLAVWEIMAISSFLLVLFEHWKKDTAKAGINYLIQSHIGIIFLTVAFIWVISTTGSNDFKAIEVFYRTGFA